MKPLNEIDIETWEAILSEKSMELIKRIKEIQNDVVAIGKELWETIEKATLAKRFNKWDPELYSINPLSHTAKTAIKEEWPAGYKRIELLSWAESSVNETILALMRIMDVIKDADLAQKE